MPTVHSMEIPRPKNWQDFEKIVCAAQALSWSSPNLQPNGRPGQQQKGIDIYGPDSIGRRTGIQCKRYKTLSLDIVIDEIKNAEDFDGLLSALFIATTADYDAPLQQAIRQISETRAEQGKFAVGIIFWDDIVRNLALNPQVFKNFYPQIELPHGEDINAERLLAALEVGFFGPFLWEYVQLTFGEIGEMAQQNPHTVEIIARVAEQRVMQVFSQDDAEGLRESIKEVRLLCDPLKEKTREIWDVVQHHSETVSMKIQTYASLIGGQDHKVLRTGIALGKIHHHCDDLPSKDLQKNIERQALAICPEKSAKTIKKYFMAAEKFSAGYEWAPWIYNLIENELRWAKT